MPWTHSESIQRMENEKVIIFVCFSSFSLILFYFSSAMQDSESWKSLLCFLSLRHTWKMCTCWSKKARANTQQPCLYFKCNPYRYFRHSTNGGCVMRHIPQSLPCSGGETSLVSFLSSIRHQQKKIETVLRYVFALVTKRYHLHSCVFFVAVEIFETSEELVTYWTPRSTCN